MILTDLGILAVLSPGLLFGYAYFLYPGMLRVWGSLRPAPPQFCDPPEWPMVTIVVPSYNEEKAIRRTIESLLAIDYPADRRQILIVSDASTDRTDEIVREYADRGVELLRLTQRAGKTAAENAALERLRGSIVVNTDATIRILPGSLKPLIRVFQDPAIGVASGRDVSVGDVVGEANRGESGYVGYEMWVRSLETRVGSIVGASGCFYAIRRQLHETLVPAALSRDFASALMAREHGLRAVSVDEAVCLVPRTTSLQREFRRKIRTMARGLETLWFKRHLMNPFRHGRFAWMLLSHKLARWLVFLAAPVAVIALALLSLESVVAALGLVVVLIGTLLGAVAMRAPEGRRQPRLVALCGFVLASHLAGFIAWTKALRGELNPIWEPTRRPG
jgi:cellulose synthase/poly-beta-1,6-N-acetylglucosamine synthase-like glycosyltransferase